jgi:hypothetical protein
MTIALLDKSLIPPPLGYNRHGLKKAVVPGFRG